MSSTFIQGFVGSIDGWSIHPTQPFPVHVNNDAAQHLALIRTLDTTLLREEGLHAFKLLFTELKQERSAPR